MASVAAGLACLLPLLARAADGAPPSLEELARFSIEELSEIEISSVSRRPESLRQAAAAIYVISREDIRRSGASSLPEVLRLAPNLQVARLDASRYAITARGFNGTIANKLQVLIDGRSVYTPLFSGVFWDVQDTLLADIERIEVVSGPGGTLWGSNAVNGVINVITRRAQDSIGTQLQAEAGNTERQVTARRGVRLADDASLRIYAKSFERDETFTPSGADARDGWRNTLAGFRFDWGRDADTLTVQGDGYDGAIRQGASPDVSMGGFNLLGRWNRRLADDGNVQVQTYYDRTRRQAPGSLGEVLETWDLDLQHHLRWGARQDIVWGGGYRLMHDDVSNIPGVAFLPAQRDLQLTNIFVQDSIALNPAWKLTLGAKLEHNSYTGLEFMPDARLAWQLNPNALLWGAVSRAARTPSRIDRDFFVPGPPSPPVRLAGGPDFQSEKLTAYELGYRAQATNLSYSVTAFHHDYDRLRSLEPAPGGGFPFVIANGMRGQTEGVETWGSLQVNPDWRLTAGYTYLWKRLGFAPDSRDTNLAAAGDDPTHQLFLRSSHNLRHGLELDLSLRAIGELPNPAVPGYVAVDARIGWTVARGIELSLIGNNLLDQRHQEFASSAGGEFLGRSLQAKLQWNF
ncbi:TonB-dependent receptor plug domain-containing protein [Rhodoferax ferrireducens]|uniref:TonB-dependent receptor plug domain-containing protein n=1 Tax=Rhodoferax ferrireducens TaxID=192843 RepID=UPI001E2E6731|nr:TonB-dependent receptor [Rhodoferax ferrireducens]